MVFANGGLLPSFGRIIKRAIRLETQKGSHGVAIAYVDVVSTIIFQHLSLTLVLGTPKILQKRFSAKGLL